MLMELGLVEQRLKAAHEVLDGAAVTDVAKRNGVTRQTVHTWLRRYASSGSTSKPETCPHQMTAVVEARIVEMRRTHPAWVRGPSAPTWPEKCHTAARAILDLSGPGPSPTARAHSSQTIQVGLQAVGAVFGPTGLRPPPEVIGEMGPTARSLSPRGAPPERYAMTLRYRDDLLKGLESRRTEVVSKESAVRGQGEEVREDERVDPGDGVDGETGHQVATLDSQDVLAVVDLDDIVSSSLDDRCIPTTPSGIAQISCHSIR